MYRPAKKSLYICFVDFERLLIGYRTQNLSTLLKFLHWQQKAILTTKDNNSKQIEIHNEVYQGCILSPILFNIFSKNIFGEALENVMDEISVYGEVINSIRYAYDTVLVVNSDMSCMTLFIE